VPELGRGIVADNSRHPIRKPVLGGRPITPQKRNVRPPRGDPTKTGRSPTKVGGGLTYTITGPDDISPNTIVPLQQPPPPLCQKSEINVAKVPHTQPPSHNIYC